MIDFLIDILRSNDDNIHVSKYSLVNLVLADDKAHKRIIKCLLVLNMSGSIKNNE